MSIYRPAPRPCRDNARRQRQRRDDRSDPGGRGMQFVPRALANIEVDQSPNARDIQMNRFRLRPAISWSDHGPLWIDAS